MKKFPKLPGPDEQREIWQHHVKVFNEKHPVGSTVWYWQSKNFGPVYETTVRQAAEFREAGPVVWLDGFDSPIDMELVRKVREGDRNEVNPIPPGSHGAAERMAECEKQISRAHAAIKAWQNFFEPGYGDHDHLRVAAECLRFAADEAEKAYQESEGK